MNVGKNNTATSPFMMSSHLLNPPEIEKIIDTTLTKDNRRYYKVKWVKTTWESEEDLTYFSGVIDSFWAQYTKECLMQPEDVNKNDDTDYSTGMASVSNKDVYNFVVVPPNEVVSPEGSNKRDENLNTDILSQHSESDELLPLSNHDMLSPSCSVSEVPTSTDLLTSHLNANDLDIIVDSCKTLTDFAQEYDYHLAETGLMRTSNQEEDSPRMTEPVATCEKTPPMFPCSTCSKTFISKAELKKHINSCEGITYKCSLCDTIYKSKEKYLKHEKSHANRKCPICGKEFQRLGHLKTHLYQHNNIRPFSCDQCKKSFPDKSSLVKHTLVHTTERKFSCNQCSMKFKRAQHLRRHIESHKQVRTFSCAQCEKKFHQKSALEIHLNTHTGNRPFKCETCNQSFADGATLRRHTLTHFKVKPFKCKECNKEFCRSSSLKAHMSSKLHNSANKQEEEQNS